jgi:hypothetical protein
LFDTTSAGLFLHFSSEKSKINLRTNPIL